MSDNILSNASIVGNGKPGRCPAVLPDSIGPCVDLPICNVDSDCYGVQKCCPNGPNGFPVDPKPGTCPVLPPGSAGTCAEHCSVDSDCQDVQKCCSNGCGHDCFFPAWYLSSTPPDTAGTCVDLCSVDSDCLGDQKCCSHGCGHSCSSPVSSCPPEPKCPIPPRGPPGTCKPQCIFEYKVINGLRCRIKCVIGPQGPRGPPCPPTGCPGAGQPEPAAQQGFSGALLGEHHCPVDPGPNSNCYGHYHRYCNNDSSCPKRTKCCKQGCSYKCVDAV
ncbi:WFDC3 [Mytilus coruscus]|uniref:WFDC3 n=1 Tax=Mytilus coruscus TaxID=42192 RepID=A0A6J7ZVY3_MYTCO|nr:WFDC3 [Mytilus coruscus]